MKKPLALLAVLLAALLAAGAALAQNPPDLKGAQDHPLLQRFEGAWLVGYRQKAFDQVQWPKSGKIKDWDHLAEVADFEGRVTRLAYITPKGKTPLEVFRNHEQALAAAGFRTLWRCDTKCDESYSRWQRHLKPQDDMSFLDASIDTSRGSRYNISRPMRGEDARLWVGELPRAEGGVVRVQLMTSAAVNELTERAATWVQILEPAEMQTGQVVVNAQQLAGTLGQAGKVALYGLLFDTGKSVLKPESQGQLAEMVALLKSQPTLKVFIVGHTDNVGGFEANRALSLARAQAVVAALAQAGIAPDRLTAQGVANLAPVALNSNDAGRAKNRRVELVAQ
jgi:OmpA-OmpF porin, OOP family